MEEDGEQKVDAKINCKVCGEREFDLRDGFFYCNECGTKQESVREIEVDQEDMFNDPKHQKKLKLSKAKDDKLELTSWETYNYILRGLVEELLSFGAKEELKLMALQVWAAYLRSMEVAFFSKNHPDLPRLGVRYLNKDARVLYNHTKQMKKQKRSRSETGSCTSGERIWRRKKRKLDELNYSVHSQSTPNSSSTGTTTHAIQLKYSAWSRKVLKRIMPLKHLEKHEKDADGTLECHKTKPLARSLHRRELSISTISIKHMYAVLAIALNLVDDNITLSDLMRLISEGHLGSKKVMQYFPENIAKSGHQHLRDIEFYRFSGTYPDKTVRDHVAVLARSINMPVFHQTDILKLAKRYITELNLPADIAMYVERLINILPPTMKTRAPYMYPHYEGRAMAYVVFVLKLLFGLDGHKEKLISRSAETINKQIQRLRKLHSLTHPLLFVWNDWVQYVEMRKVIVSQYNAAFCRQFKQCATTAQLLEQLDAQHRQEHEDNVPLAETVKQSAVNQSKRDNFRITFEKLLQAIDGDTPPEPVQLISFPPSVTPAHSYFKRILLHASTDGGKYGVVIPEYMRVDHTQHTLQPLLQSRTLRQFFSAAHWQLKVQRLNCTPNRSFVGVFRPHSAQAIAKTDRLAARKARCAVSEKAWVATITDEPIIEDLDFKTVLDSYNSSYQIRREQLATIGVAAPLPEWLLTNKVENQQHAPKVDPKHQSVPSDVNETNDTTASVDKRSEMYDVKSLCSFKLFNENNMNPEYSIDLTKPRRNLDRVCLFADISDDESEEPSPTNDSLFKADLSSISCDSDDDDRNTIETDKFGSRTLTLMKSELDCWTLVGVMALITDVQKKTLKSKFPRSFSWLIETCAQTIGVDWAVVYEQLLVIELMFLYGTEKLDNYQDCIYFSYNNPIKDINNLINTYREIW